jgi:hypothetical protein
VLKHAWAGLQVGEFAPPVEVVITSATGDPLIHLRLTAFERHTIKICDESKWRTPDVLPVTVTITDGAGKVEMWEVDPRSQSIN